MASESLSALTSRALSTNHLDGAESPCGGLGFCIAAEVAYRPCLLFWNPSMTQNIRNIRIPRTMGGIKAYTVASQDVSVPKDHVRDRTRTTHPQEMMTHIRKIPRRKFIASHPSVLGKEF